MNLSLPSIIIISFGQLPCVPSWLPIPIAFFHKAFSSLPHFPPLLILGASIPPQNNRRREQLKSYQILNPYPLVRPWPYLACCQRQRRRPLRHSFAYHRKSQRHLHYLMVRLVLARSLQNRCPFIFFIINNKD